MGLLEPNGYIYAECDPVELLLFLSRDLAPMHILCERGRRFERLIYHRSKAVFEYFGLPLDPPPPPMPASAGNPH